MLQALTDKLTGVFRGLSGRGRISEENVREALREVRTALLEADVNFEVVKQFTDSVLQKAIGQEVINTLQPGQKMVEIVYQELVNLMGPVDTQIYFVQPGPTIIMMCGLQGSGKTTTCGKLAKYLVSKGHNPMLCAADLQRPAAVEQLRVVGQTVGVPVYTDDSKIAPHGQVARGAAVAVCRGAISQAKQTGRDVVILDTAGRLHVDDELMGELREINGQLKPSQIYLVLDAMSGQDAVNSAKAFNAQLELDGLILTKFDSDTRGGALLSAKMVTGKPVKFIGTGEKLDRLEEFRPEGMASRILGMGDIVQLVSEAQEQMMKMGEGDVEAQMNRMQAIYNSMTPAERKNVDVIDGNRRRRISRGAGVQLNEVGQFIKQFEQSRDMIRAVGGMGMRGKMGMMKALMSGNLASLGMPGGPQLKTKKSGFMEKKDRNKKKKRR